MRELFISEKHYIQNILSCWTTVKLEYYEPVVLEYHALRRSSVECSFNEDYFLQFVPPEDLKNFKSFNSTILPNTLGADLFLTVDKDTSRPLRTELVGGDAFSIKYYRIYIKHVEDRLDELSKPVRLNKCAYCRIFVIESDICFLAFPNEEVPVMRGNSQILCSDSDSVIQCLTENNGIVCIDGWIRTSATQNGWKLVATAE